MIVVALIADGMLIEWHEASDRMLETLDAQRKVYESEGTDASLILLTTDWLVDHGYLSGD